VFFKCKNEVVVLIVTWRRTSQEQSGCFSRSTPHGGQRIWKLVG